LQQYYSMKTLYLVRHAKSSWETEGQEDFERPLNSRGRSDAPEMGRRLYLKGVKPQLILCSAAFRTLATARILARELAYPSDSISVSFRIYQANAGKLLDLLAEQSNAHESVLLVGHNPGMHELSVYLSGSPIAEFPTCTVAAIAFEIDSWKDLKRNSGKLLYVETPKNV
jgi:phosphohistidine phosphatase